MASKADNPITLSFTNKAIGNVKEQLKEYYPFSGLEKECYSFDRYFCDYHGRDISTLEHKTVCIDEYNMIPNNIHEKITQI